jgi:hypothetical protein
MSPGDYLELWRSQDKKCAICSAALTLYHRDTHVHVFGYAKRLLCTTCKRGMECFRDDPTLLVKALEHIKDSSGDENKGEQTQPSQDKSAGENSEQAKS